MKIAIVILNWNGEELLKKFLPSIIQYSPKENCSIYIADNASTDASVSVINELFPEVRVIQNNENGGFAKGYNEALKHIKADIYALINSDIEVTENWLQPIIDQFKSEEAIAIIQPKILDYNNKDHFEYAGAAGGYLDYFGYPYCRGRIFNTLEKDVHQFDDSIDIFWASGACLCIRSSVFHRLGGFDESYFAHQEEIDLCWRAHHLNFKVKYNGKSTVYHVGGATLKSSSPKKTYLNFRNSLFSIVKNVTADEVFKIVFMRLCLDGIAGVKFLLELKPLHTIAIVKAHFNFYSKIAELRSKRPEQPFKNYFQTKSVVWNYFIRKKKTFNEL